MMIRLSSLHVIQSFFANSLGQHAIHQASTLANPLIYKELFFVQTLHFGTKEFIFTYYKNKTQASKKIFFKCRCKHSIKNEFSEADRDQIKIAFYIYNKKTFWYRVFHTISLFWSLLIETFVFNKRKGIRIAFVPYDQLDICVFPAKI